MVVVWHAAHVFLFNRRAGVGVPGLHRVQGRGSQRGLVCHDLQRLSRHSLVQPQHNNIHREEGEDSEFDPDVDDVYCALMLHENALLPTRTGTHCTTPNDYLVLLFTRAGRYLASSEDTRARYYAFFYSVFCLCVGMGTFTDHGYTLAMFLIL